MPFALIALGAFWIAAIKLWILDGARIPLICIGLWLLTYVVTSRLHWSPAVFTVVECLLAVILFLIDRYKSATL
jgi:hypothetical protein